MAYTTFMVATAFSAWFLGWAPALLTIGLGLITGNFFFTPPAFSLAFSRSELPETITYLVASGVFLLIGDAKQKRTALLIEKNREIEAANVRLREMSVNLMRAQDDERRKIARDLHDSVGQYLSADRHDSRSDRQAREGAALRCYRTRGGSRGDEPDVREGSAHHLAPASSAITRRNGALGRGALVCGRICSAKRQFRCKSKFPKIWTVSETISRSLFSGYCKSLSPMSIATPGASWPEWPWAPIRARCGWRCAITAKAFLKKMAGRHFVRAWGPAECRSESKNCAGRWRFARIDGNRGKSGDSALCGIGTEARV